jgi:hypothetical protein
VKVLVVDAANVMGSRPDGWWRDRAAAAERLRDQLASAALPFDEVFLVLEGAAKRSRAEDDPVGVRIVLAPAEGDDQIVATTRSQLDAGRAVAVVTADRGLRSRVEAVGAEVVGPSWLLEQL